MPRWTVSSVGERCGGCGDVIPPHQPIALMTTKALIRCRSCAGGPVDQPAIDQERMRIERDRSVGDAHDSPPAPYWHRPSVGFSKLSESARTAFDPKAAAAGKDD